MRPVFFPTPFASRSKTVLLGVIGVKIVIRDYAWSTAGVQKSPTTFPDPEPSRPQTRINFFGQNRVQMGTKLHFCCSKRLDFKEFTNLLKFCKLKSAYLKRFSLSYYLVQKVDFYLCVKFDRLPASSFGGFFAVLGRKTWVNAQGGHILCGRDFNKSPTRIKFLLGFK